MLPRPELMLTGKTDFPVSLKGNFSSIAKLFWSPYYKEDQTRALPGLLCSIADSVKSLSLQSAVGLAVCRHSQVYSSVQVHRRVPGHCWEGSALGKDLTSAVHSESVLESFISDGFSFCLFYYLTVSILSTFSWKNIVAVFSMSKYKGCELHRNKLTCWTSWD